MMSSTASGGLNWTQIVDTGAKIFDQVKNISPQMSPILESVQRGDLQELWQNGANAMAAMAGPDNAADPRGYVCVKVQ